MASNQHIDPLPPLKAWLEEDAEGRVMTLVEDPSFAEYTRYLIEQFDAAWRALNCSHNNIPPDDPDNPWIYKEIDGNTYNYCPECGLAELWQGGQFFGAKLAGVSSPANSHDALCRCGRCIGAPSWSPATCPVCGHDAHTPRYCVIHDCACGEPDPASRSDDG